MMHHYSPQQQPFDGSLSQEELAMLLFDNKHQQQHNQQSLMSPPQEPVSSFTEFLIAPCLPATTDATTTTAMPASWDAYYWSHPTDPAMSPCYPTDSAMSMAPAPVETITVDPMPFYDTTHASPVGGEQVYYGIEAPPSPPLSTSTAAEQDEMTMTITQEVQHQYHHYNQQHLLVPTTTAPSPPPSQQQQQQQHVFTTTEVITRVAPTHRGRTKQQQQQEGGGGNSIFQCHECHKQFTRPYNLKSHMRTHTKERPYVCDFEGCPWKFARPHDLKRHQLLHSGVKPHKCPNCDRRFARRDALRRHWNVDEECGVAVVNRSVAATSVLKRRRGRGAGRK